MCLMFDGLLNYSDIDMGSNPIAPNSFTKPMSHEILS